MGKSPDEQPFLAAYKLRLASANSKTTPFNALIFYTPLSKGGRIKKLNSNLVKNFCYKYLGKVKKLRFKTYMRLKAINKNS